MTDLTFLKMCFLVEIMSLHPNSYRFILSQYRSNRQLTCYSVFFHTKEIYLPFTYFKNDKPGEKAIYLANGKEN